KKDEKSDAKLDLIEKLKKKYEHNPPQLMEFFDDFENWAAQEVKTGRPWKLDELRIKSNEDLHKLWYILLKERNMLLTMQEASNNEYQLFPSPERIEKVEESMENIESVVRERNKAYWELEVGEGLSGERPVSFRKDIFGRYTWIPCAEHLIPYALNKKWRQTWGPGHGKYVDDFVRKWYEVKINQAKKKVYRDAYTVRQLLRKFPDIDLEYLQEKYRLVPVQYMKENLDYYTERTYISRGVFKRYN
ncbi:39S ribosomal protein L47-like protein, partial [Leptotrombidium deliense]